MYQQIVSEGDRFRRAYKEGIDAYLKRLEAEGNRNRERFFPAEGFADRLEEYRQSYTEMLGIHRLPTEALPDPVLTRVGEDADAVIYRAAVPITQEIPLYGLLFVPHGAKKTPLVIAQHGGGGTPELCADLNGTNNYNHLVRRLLKRGASVFAPQLLLWNWREPLPMRPAHPIEFDRAAADNQLKRFGLSLTALEIKGIMQAITFLSAQSFIDAEKIGMAGLSYGGYYTLHTMAADVRIRAGYSSACFNDRNVYPWQDWSYPDSANRFHDAEVAALCAPRKLYVAVGKTDAVFDYQSAVSEAERAKQYFAACGCPGHFVFEVWDGGHTVSPADDGFDFLFSAF